MGPLRDLSGFAAGDLGVVGTSRGSLWASLRFRSICSGRCCALASVALSVAGAWLESLCALLGAQLGALKGYSGMGHAEGALQAVFLVFYHHYFFIITTSLSWCYYINFYYYFIIIIVIADE